MSLRYIVPTMGLMAFTAVPASAVDVNGLTVNGYVDSVLEISDGDDAVRGDDMTIDWSASAQLEIGYAVGDQVTANVELFWQDNDNSNNNATTQLEQAYINWAVTEQVSITMGKFHNSIGWEALDAPGLYRVNNSHMYSTWSQGGNGGFGTAWGLDVTGVGAVVVPNDQVEFGLYLLDGIYSENATGKATDAIGINAYVTALVEGIGTFDLDIMYGQEEAPAFGGAVEEDAFGIDLNGEITALSDEQGLLFAFDFNYVDYDAAAGFGLLLLANYVLPTEIDASATLSLNYVEPNDDTDDDESIEIAVALLTAPTDHDNFALNLELAYISREADDSDEFGFFLEMLAVIP